MPTRWSEFWLLFSLNCLLEYGYSNASHWELEGAHAEGSAAFVKSLFEVNFLKVFFFCCIIFKAFFFHHQPSWSNSSSSANDSAAEARLCIVRETSLKLFFLGCGPEDLRFNTFASTALSSSTALRFRLGPYFSPFLLAFSSK